MNKKFLVLIIIVIIIAVVYIWKPSSQEEELLSNVPEIITANFLCQNNKSIQAIFSTGGNSSVDLVLSDGRTLQLPQVISASGARYANEDESFVFWNKGDTAFVEEGEAITFQDCLVEGKND